MKVILDTNVFVSGIFWSGPPHARLTAWRHKKIQLVISPEIFQEYKRVALDLSTRYPGGDLSDVMALLAAETIASVSPTLPQPVCSDTDDDKFLACALANNISHIVTGDKALLKLQGYQGLIILKPNSFFKQHLKSF